MHPEVSVKEFINDYVQAPLIKLSFEKEEVILMGDFNINLLNCNTDKDISDYIDTLYSHSFCPTINSPTRITPTSKMLIDNIFYNNASNNIISGNITTSIFDHLMQFLLIPGQLTGVQLYKAKEKWSFHNFDANAFEKDI